MNLDEYNAAIEAAQNEIKRLTKEIERLDAERYELARTLPIPMYTDRYGEEKAKPLPCRECGEGQASYRRLKVPVPTDELPQGVHAYRIEFRYTTKDGTCPTCIQRRENREKVRDEWYRMDY